MYLRKIKKLRRVSVSNTQYYKTEIKLEIKYENKQLK